ncbi:hypothetical protein GW17_00020600 [Ensete ventricosum]|nr:hypothetical protein GW17_00020600 [Ensete ventricosum]
MHPSLTLVTHPPLVTPPLRIARSSYDISSLVRSCFLSSHPLPAPLSSHPRLIASPSSKPCVVSVVISSFYELTLASPDPSLYVPLTPEFYCRTVRRNPPRGKEHLSTL